MRGSPFLQTIFMVAVILLTGVPVYRLTRPAQALTTPGASSTEAALADRPGAQPVPLEIEVVFAPAAADFQLKNLDHNVLSGQGPQARFYTVWTTLVPMEGVDLVLQAHWPALAVATHPNPAAARVTVRFADGQQVEQTYWAATDGVLSEVFTVPGQASSPTP